jgi:hypothetical protein
VAGSGRGVVRQWCEEVEMEERDRSEEMQRAAQEFSGAVERFAEYVDRLEEVIPKPGLPDHDADEFALKAVHYARSRIGRQVETDAPDREAVAEWVRRRAERREAERAQGT